MASILSNSQNVLITGGQLISNSTRIEGSQNGIDLLRQRSALSALLDSSERFDPPKCAPDTRISIIHEIIDWITNEDDASSMMWLYGPAGAGKSALAQSIAELCRKEKRLAASFFFSRTALNRNDGATRRFVKESIEEDPTIFERANETRMEQLVIEPLNRFAISWSNLLSIWMKQRLGCFVESHPRLIVIDGLDECLDPKIQCDLLKAIGEATQRLKLPVKFLIASRPESHIIHVFNHEPIFQKVDVSSINLALDNDAHRDIRTFLSKEFDAIKRTHPLREYLHGTWPTPDSIRQLVRKASGQFIYASTVLKYIQSPKHRPDDRLSVILGISPAPSHDTPFAELDALYTHIFASVGNIHAVIRIFGILIIRRSERDSPGDFTTPSAIERLLFFRPGEVQLLLGDLLSLIALSGRDTPIKVLHASLADYLLEPSRSGKFHVDLEVVHSLLARYYLKRASDVITVYNLNPIDFQTSMTSFLAHCERASRTQELQQYLLTFDFASICKTLVARHKAWLVLNPFYMWFLIKSFVRLLSGEIFQNAAGMDVYLSQQLDAINEFLIRQLKSSVTDNYLSDLVPRIWKRPKYTNFSCSHTRHEDDGQCLCRKIAIAACTAQYLTILCQLFYWDYNGTFTANIHIRYATAVKQCFAFLSIDLSENQLLHAERMVRRFPTGRLSDYVLTEAHLNCAAVLLPHACYTGDLVEYLSQYTFLPSLTNRHPSQVDELTKEIVSYLRDVEPSIDVTRWDYDHRWDYD
ncbi:hypothetical protein BDZ97DRAFT_1914653 [Flammula alnicola]|nr:hypothetical protein BDZ97DRAFT_1914653 [Flammula alnicola]